MTAARNGNGDRRAALLFLALLVPILFVIGAAAVNARGAASFPVIVIGGAVVMIVTLAAIALLFALSGMNDNRYAFGLPDGSIRAILAVGLFAAFVGTAGFLYTGLSSPDSEFVDTAILSETDLPQKEKEFIVVRRPEPDGSIRADGKVRVALYSRHSNANAANDLAKTIFTTVATALVTIIGFYFGSASLSAAVSAVQSINVSSAPGSDAERASSLETNMQRVGANSEQAAKAVADTCENALKPGTDPASAEAVQLQAAAKKAPELLASVKDSLAVVAKQLALVRNADTPKTARQEAFQAADTALAAARKGADQLAALRGEADDAARKLTPAGGAPLEANANRQKAGQAADRLAAQDPVGKVAPARLGPDLSPAH